MSGVFVAGTDTGVGKTVVAAGLMSVIKQLGHSVAGYKPVAAGCENAGGGWRNEDAIALLAQSSVDVDYDDVNPVALPDAIAPHIAAQNIGATIEMDLLAHKHADLQARADSVVVEGAGGWLVPLTEQQDMADLAQIINHPVILVVGLRLGCINHARLSAQAIAASGLTLAAWVGVKIDPDMPELAGNIATLRRYLPSPCAGIVPWLDEPAPDAVAKSLDFEIIQSIIDV